MDLINNNNSPLTNKSSFVTSMMFKYSSFSSIKPTFNGYQLLGDSIFVRFSNNILRQFMPAVNGTPTVGLCSSGQRIKQLSAKIKKNVYPLTSKVLLLIGTNDVLVGRKLHEMTTDYKNLITLLRLRKVTNIVILTLPPIPKLAVTRKHWELVTGFNKFLLGMDDPIAKVSVVDIESLFVKHSSAIIAAPPSCPFQPPAPPPLADKTGKRRADSDSNSDDEMKETPKKIRKIDPLETEEDDAKLSPFCKYLNRVNRSEKEDELVSSDDDSAGYLPHVKAFIDYPFWRVLKASIPYDEDEDNLIQDTLETLTSETSAASNAAGKDTEVTSNGIEGTPNTPVAKLSIIEKRIMRYTNQFLHLNCYELIMGYGNNQRMDMIHPNATGLHRLQAYLSLNLPSA